MNKSVAWGLALLVILGVGLGIGVWVGAKGASQAGYGSVCGVTALAGGPPGVTGIKDPSLLSRCPSGAHHTSQLFSLMASDGRLYKAEGDNNDSGWFAHLPAGAYQVTGRPGCPNRGPAFIVGAGKTLLGYVVWWGCEYK